MDRRDFVRIGAVAGAAAITGRPLAGQALNGSSEFTRGSERFAISPFDLEEATFGDLQAGMAAGRMTSVSITRQYIARIEELDRKGPTLRHVLEINPDALAIADSLDRERKSGRVRSPLHGIPILLKDNIDTADRMTTTAGSLALEGSIPLQDAFIAAKLRAAGAVLLGKTNLSDFRSTHSSSGWSGRGGQAKNPYVLDRNPCGSSSGSGGAVSANLCAAAIGTETDGSIVCPSSANGIVGIKPTLGLVSRSGIIPIAHSQDTAGPMTRTVRDAAIILNALTGIDPRDPATRSAQARGLIDYTRSLDPNGLRGARIGIARDLFGGTTVPDKIYNDAIDVMKAQGAVIVDPARIKNFDKFGDSEFDVLLYEFKADLNAYLAGLGSKAPVKSLQDIIDFNERNKDREMPWFGQEIMVMAQKKGPLSEKKYRDELAKNIRISRTQGIDATMTKYKLDALFSPTGGLPWVTDLVNGDHFTGGGSSTLPAVAGYPNINVPAGFSHNLPMGISFFGRAYSEPALFKLAYAYEQATKHRRAPEFIPSLAT
jgi:amidase